MSLQKSLDAKSAPTYSSPKSYKKIALGVLFIIVAFLLFLFGAYPLYSNYQKNNKLIEAEKLKIQQLDLRLAQLDKIKKIAETVNSSTAVALQAVPEDSEIPVVMAMGQEIAKKSGVKITSFSYSGMGNTVTTVSPVSNTTDTSLQNSNSLGSPTTKAGLQSNPKEDYDNFSMQLTVVGTFSDIKRLINNLETSRRILDVKSFTYNVNTSETEIVGNTITLKVTLFSYFKLFSPLADNINLEQYTPLLKKLNDLAYTEIDLSNPNVGKINPFNSTQESTNPTVTPTPGAQNNAADDESFFNNDSNKVPINIVELEGTGSTQTTEEEAPIEAEEGDTTKLLQDLLKQEGL